ncbi:MAG TPA: DUF4340 domain-containing protein [Kofleriaceae bacterium]|nr:DUF4340 domain-containing protein [Kofleriaceae bacterium]
MKPRTTIVIERAVGAPVRLLVGGGAGPTDRVWMAREGREGRALVDGYAARALDLSADDLRERRPFRGRTAGATRIEIGAGGGATVLAGPPWRVQLPGGAARADPVAVQELLDQLSRLRIEEFAPPAGAPGAPWLTVVSPAGRSGLALRGTCASGASLADTALGTGCLRLPAQLAEAGRDPQSLVDRALVGAPIDDVARLRLERGGRSIDVARADSPEALRAWLTRWRAAASGPVVPADRLAPLATLELETTAGQRERVTAGRTRDGRLAARRDDEPVALLLHPWADAHLEPAAHRFRSLDLLAYEPSALRAASARQGGRVVEAIERGDTMEEWRASAPPGASVPPAAAEALRQAAGFLRADAFSAPAARPAHRLSPPRRTVDLTFDPAPGEAEPHRHELAIGGPTAARGCYARLDQDPTVFELAPARCQALLGPWTLNSRKSKVEGRK